MKKLLLIILFLSFLSYNLYANEIIDRFIKAVKSKETIQYLTIRKMNDDSKGLSEDSSYCKFKIVPEDTTIGAYYNFKYNETTVIYNGNEYLECKPEVYGNKIVKLLLRAKKPEEFSERKFNMSGHSVILPSIVKNNILYLCSPFELMNKFIKLKATKPAITLSDTMINGYNTCRVRFTIKDTIVGDERELVYYLIAFDKKTDFPVYFLEYYNNRQFETYYSEYNFNTNINKDLFSRKDFPKNYKFVENPKMIEQKRLKIGNVAPDWTLNSIYEKEIKLKDLKGTPVFLIFSEIGCFPCLIAIPDLIEIADTYKNIKVISIYPNDKRELLKKYAGKNKIVYDILDNEVSVATDYHIKGYPTFFLIDRNGIVKYISTGYGDGMKKILENEIEKILKE